MNIAGKVWGSTQEIFSKLNVEIHRITVNSGGYCSKHCHEHKFNAFYVEKGTLKIKVWKNDYDLCDETIIHTGEMCVVNPKEYHQFEALDNTIAFEIYWVELDSKDIVRDDCGGIEQKTLSV